MDNIVIIATLIVYKLVLIGVGLWAAQRNKTEGDFFLAGQGLGPWVAGLSYAASTSSAWVLLGFSGFVYANGLSALWMVPGIWGGYIAIWLWFGKRLRAETAAEGHVTVLDFLTARVSGPMRGLIAATGALMIVFCFVFYIAAQFGAAGNAFESQFDLGRNESVLIGAAVVIVYGLLGGFWAVSVTDTLQGALMAVIALLLPAAALIAAGGPAGVMAALAASAPEGYLDWTGGMAGHVLIGFVLGVWGVGLGALGQPQLLVRLMAIKDESARRRGFVIAMSWGVAVFVGMTVLALSGRALLGGGYDGEALFYQVARELLSPVLAGLVIAAVLSAVMSTVDSVLLVAASAVSHDLRLAKRNPKRELLISRAVMAGIAIFSVWLALTVEQTIFARVLFAWAALGAAFGPVVIARVMKREPAGWAIWAAMVTGFALTVIFNAYGQAGATGPDWLIALATAPGDVWERVAPWAVPLVVLFGFSKRAD